MLNRMNDKIIHRGPDDDGVFVENNENYTVALGMRRLSIIDPNKGKQPMFSDDCHITVVFNGEIYNYLNLKSDLIKNHHQTFKTNSDTEVILKIYEVYGTKGFDLLDGMFAFSVFDKSKQKIFITRDFFGEKPMYYTKNEDGFYWASELKSILSVIENRPTISKKGLSLFFQLTYIPAPYSIYDNIYKLKANHYIVLDINTFDLCINEMKREVGVEKYINVDFQTAKNITHDLVMESVISRAVSDVPLGVFLSGGVDSSVVSCCLAQQMNTPINTFSMGFEKKAFNETKKSKLVAKIIGSNHHEFMLSADILKEDAHDVLLNFDEPFADSSALPTYLLAKKTKKFVKVVLTGDGGDEVFGGYNKYYMGKLNQNYTQFIPNKIHQLALNTSHIFTKSNNDKRGKRYKLKRLLEAVNYNHDFYFNIIALAFQQKELTSLLKESTTNDVLSEYKTGEAKNLNDFRNIDKMLSLEGDMLVKVDRVSMFNSLESRAPFLNKNLWDFTDQLPDNYLIKGWDKKHLLKNAFKQYFPKNFLDKSKKGFALPVGDWLRSVFKDELLGYVDPVFLKTQNIFNENYIREIVHNHIEAKNDNTFRVWSFYCFQKWYKHNFLKNSIF